MADAPALLAAEQWQDSTESEAQYILRALGIDRRNLSGLECLRHRTEDAFRRKTDSLIAAGRIPRYGLECEPNPQGRFIDPIEFAALVLPSIPPGASALERARALTGYVNGLEVFARYLGLLPSSAVSASATPPTTATAPAPVADAPTPATAAEPAPADNVPLADAGAAGDDSENEAAQVPARQPRKTWRDVAWDYMAGRVRAGRFATAVELNHALHEDAGSDSSPFDKGIGHHRGSLWVREIGKPLTLKTIQNHWAELQDAAR
ncbi:MAG: hypothetical protein KGO01_02515 [Burkholderiales bacterium]|nr:hypothetical protein [Burkholderiales bacterium]